MNKAATYTTNTTNPTDALTRAYADDGNDGRAPAIKYRPRSRRFYFDVGIGSVCVSGADTGGAYCVLEVGAAPGVRVPRHTHTREDEVYFVLSGELEVVVGEEKFVLEPGDSLMAPRDIPHQLRNPGKVENHYLLVFSPAGFDEFVMATAVPAPDNAAAPTERQLQGDDPATTVENVLRLASEYGILFG
jgi:mannose-6-phosphate isomerase-like protein (cupin superfamily)